MRKTFRLNIEGKNRDRLLEASKHEIRKYMRRERGKQLPAGFDVWDFDTKSGVEEASAVVVPVAELIRSIDALVAAGNEQFFVEVLRKPAKRNPRPAGTDAPASTDDSAGAETDFED